LLYSFVHPQQLQNMANQYVVVNECARVDGLNICCSNCRLPEILAAVMPQRRAELQHGLIKLHRAFIWGPAPYDEQRDVPLAKRGLAFNLTIESLRRSYRGYEIEKLLHSDIN